MANEAYLTGVASKLGGVSEAVFGRQHLLTNEYGVTSVITDAHYQRLITDAQASKEAMNQFKRYTIVENISDEELAALAGVTPEVQNVKPTKKGTPEG